LERTIENLTIATRAIRNISRRKMRTLLVIIALGFSMAIMVSVPAGIMANQAASEQVIANYDTTINNMEAEINKTITLIECSVMSGFTPPTDWSGFGPGSGAAPGSGPGMIDPRLMTRTESYLNETAVDDIKAIEGVKDLVPIVEKTVGTNQTRETPRGSFQILVPDYTIVGVPLSSSLIEEYAILPENIISGRNLLEGDTCVVLLSTNNTEYFSAGVGDTVSILGSSFTVIGIYEPADNSGETDLYVSILDAQIVANLTGKLSRLDVYAQDQSYVSSIASEIEALYPEATVSTYDTRLSQIEQMQENYQTVLENAQATLAQTQSVAYQEIGIAVAATSLIVLFMMLYTVRERTHEIGVLKAIGFSNSSIMSQFMVEGILLSTIAASVGVAIAVVGAPTLSSLLLPALGASSTRPNGTIPGQGIIGLVQTSTTITALTPQLILLAFGSAALLGAIGSLYPAWRASRTSPMEALKYE
jgi:putative ABC transport system permease protein